jgi:hypothetical protein
VAPAIPETACLPGEGLPGDQAMAGARLRTMWDCTRGRVPTDGDMAAKGDVTRRSVRAAQPPRRRSVLPTTPRARLLG